MLSSLYQGQREARTWGINPTKCRLAPHTMRYTGQKSASEVIVSVVRTCKQCLQTLLQLLGDFVPRPGPHWGRRPSAGPLDSQNENSCPRHCLHRVCRRRTREALRGAVPGTDDHRSGLDSNDDGRLQGDVLGAA